MSPFDWFKKEKPLQGLTGLWGGVGSNLISGGASGGPAGYEASGGTESTTTEANPAPIGGQGVYKIHKFTSDGQLTVTTAGTEQQGLTGGQRIECLVVGGGGGGGLLGGGGGGGGVAYVYKDSLAAGTYAVTIGAGGDGDHGWSNRRSHGIGSQAGPISVKGGGFGASYSNHKGLVTYISNGGGSSPHGSSQSGLIGHANYPGWTNIMPVNTPNSGTGSGSGGGGAPSGCCPCTGGGGGGSKSNGASAGPEGGPAPGGQGFGPFNYFGAGGTKYVGGGGGNNGYCGQSPSSPYGGAGGSGGGGGGGSQAYPNVGAGAGGSQTYGGNDGQPGQTNPENAGGSQGGNGGTNSGGGGGAGSNGGGQPHVHGGEGGSGIAVFRYRIE